MILLWILCIILCAVLGSSKGYSVWVCIVAGALGSLLAVLVLFLLPDQNQEAADFSRQDREIAALRQRVAELERAQQPAKEPVALAKTPAAPASPPDAPAVFPVRTEEVIACPRCGRRQKGNRDSCYACGLPFQYETESGQEVPS